MTVFVMTLWSALFGAIAGNSFYIVWLLCRVWDTERTNHSVLTRYLEHQRYLSAIEREEVNRANQ